MANTTLLTPECSPKTHVWAPELTRGFFPLLRISQGLVCGLSAPGACKSTASRASLPDHGDVFLSVHLLKLAVRTLLSAEETSAYLLPPTNSRAFVSKMNKLDLAPKVPHALLSCWPG